jgi:hypothetical protein
MTAAIDLTPERPTSNGASGVSAKNGAKKAPPQLAAEGIAKSFGSLVVLEDV